MLVFYQILCVIGFRFRPIFIQDLLPIVIFMLVTKNSILIQNNFYYGCHPMFYIHQCKGLCFGNLRGNMGKKSKSGYSPKVHNIFNVYKYCHVKVRGESTLQ